MQVERTGSKHQNLHQPIFSRHTYCSSLMYPPLSPACMRKPFDWLLQCPKHRTKRCFIRIRKMIILPIHYHFIREERTTMNLGNTLKFLSKSPKIAVMAFVLASTYNHARLCTQILLSPTCLALQWRAKAEPLLVTRSLMQENQSPHLLAYKYVHFRILLFWSHFHSF